MSRERLMAQQRARAAAAAAKAEKEAAAARAKAEREAATRAAAQRRRQAEQKIYDKHRRELTRFINAECGIEKDLMDVSTLLRCNNDTVEMWGAFRPRACEIWPKYCED